MPQEKNSTSAQGNTRNRESYEKWVPELKTEADLREALEIAFDYRGDVTITTKQGEQIIGYIFNRDAQASQPYIEYFPKNQAVKKKLLYGEIQGLAFTGIDPAAGRSWDAWVKKNEDKKKALAEGRDIGNIDLQPMPLDNE